MGKRPLKPSDFPVDADGKQIVTSDGEPVADADSESVAQDISDRLNEDEAWKEEDRWAL